MAAHIHDVVDPAQNPIIAVVIAARGIAGEVRARHFAPVLFLETLWISPYVADHSGPRTAQDQKPFTAGLHGVAVEIHDVGDDPRHWQRARAGFRRHRSRHRSDQNPSRLGLPPGIDDRTAASAYDAVIPFPCSWIDWLAYRAEQSQARKVVRLRPMIALANQRTDGRGRGIENIDAILFHQAPP